MGLIPGWVVSVVVVVCCDPAVTVCARASGVANRERAIKTTLKIDEVRWADGIKPRCMAGLLE
jgi:hypothetical protein